MDKPAILDMKWDVAKKVQCQVIRPVCKNPRMVLGSNAKRRAEYNEQDGKLYLKCQECSFRKRDEKKIIDGGKNRHKFFKDKKMKDLEFMMVDILCPECNSYRQASALYAIRQVPSLVKICRECSAIKAGKKKTEKSIIKQDADRIYSNGCILIPTAEGRCEKYFDCEHHEECLDKVYLRMWDGWKTETDSK
jgi:hypothetical protein